ncbi:MAG: nucleotide sugar dehydrogenase [PVC group bacterium]|nr:nucleotide sugar dehydrogenase [PVC group bacterium]
MKIIERIKNKKIKCAVIGLGYVGLPLAVEFAKAGYEVIGIDLDEKKVKAINKKKSYIEDVKESDVKEMVASGRLRATSGYEILKKVDTINICVPTPLRKTRDPDISYIVDACGHISNYLRKGQLVILESTTYPGTTEEMMLPILESTGLKVGKDFYLVFSPERVDPSNSSYRTKNIPKVMGGVTSNCTKAAVALYSNTMDTVVPVSSPRVAETVKLLENTFRSVNIGLVNEMALMCSKMDINVWEVIDAASTKPFGFMPFYPGPGLGGHCIPIDPLYLSWKARLYGFEARFIELASQVNSQMPEHILHILAGALNEKKKSVADSKILMMGVAYKKDVADARESPALEIFDMLSKKGAKLSYNDPFIESIRYRGRKVNSTKLTKKNLSGYDCILIITNHSSYDYKFVVENAKLIIDTRNATKNIKGKNRKKIVCL